jgi:hypothetical protein
MERVVSMTMVIIRCDISPLGMVRGEGCFSSIKCFIGALLLPYRSCYLLSERVSDLTSRPFCCSPSLIYLGFRSLVDPACSEASLLIRAPQKGGVTKKVQRLSMVPDKAKLLMEEDDDDDANEIVSYVGGADDSSGRPFCTFAR